MNSDVQTSTWPLPPSGVRLITPPSVRAALARHPLGQSCYPLALGYYPQAYGHAMRRAEHEDHLLIYCRAGQGWLETDGQRFDVQGGDLLLLPRGLAHAYGADLQRPWTLYWVHFEGTLAEAFLRPLGARPWRRLGVMPRLLAEFDALLDLRRRGLGLAHFIHAAHQLQSLLTGLAVLPAQVTLKSWRRLDVEAVQAFMQAHLHDSLSLDALAAHFRLSRFHFAKLYRELTGHAPIEGFIQLKMAKACRLLDETDLAVSRIGEQLGYADTYYFSRLFKQVVGLAPSHYRDLHRG
ncbi:MAG: AraC family transcriptional regulator [Gammaproteobacteria bacterium]|nr:AraC family transcriptional regulator [Gammaproteobacteria bacterium]